MKEQEAYIQEIAKAHGVVLGKNDPILILHTFFKMYGEDLARLQQEMLQEMASASEESIARWNAEVTVKANRIITTSLEAAKQASVAQFDSQAAALKTSINGLIEAHRKHTQNLYTKTYYLAVANMIASGLLAVAALVFFLK